MNAVSSMFESGMVTHAGRVRRHNEDRFLVQPQMGIWAVADGMGGHEGGALASATLVGSLETIGPPVSAPDLLARLEDRVIKANAELKRLARQRGAAVIGSTLAALLVYESHFAYVWSGDSRIYLVRGGSIAQLSRDHTEAQGLIDKGLLTPEEARHWPRRNVITRAIGVHDVPELEADHGELKPEDAFVLCSDGLTTHVRDEEILSHVQRTEAQAACDGLLALTLERGATDNVTIVVMRYHGPDAAGGQVGGGRADGSRDGGPMGGQADGGQADGGQADGGQVDGGQVDGARDGGPMGAEAAAEAGDRRGARLGGQLGGRLGGRLGTAPW